MVIPEGTVTRGVLEETSGGAAEPEVLPSVFTTTSWALDDPALLDRQRAWVAAFHRKLDDQASYRVSLPLRKDTYFGQVDAIYRVEV